MTSIRSEHTNWTAPGADVAAQATYASVKRALADLEQRRNIEIFLQGSYANHTNIRADSDVDIVVMTRQTFQGAHERLDAVGRARWVALPDGTYHSDDLRREVTDALTSYYGVERVHPRNKCIRVDKRDGYVDADVVPCLEYRWFRSPGSDIADYVEGVAIHPDQGARIINFPKEHRRNGEAKNIRCGGRYKSTVRQMKRLRNRAVDEGRIQHSEAPGYLLECMTYNVADPNFLVDDSDRLRDVVLSLRHSDKSSFISCDGIHTLFGTDPGGYTVAQGQRVIDALWDAF